MRRRPRQEPVDEAPRGGKRARQFIERGGRLEELQKSPGHSKIRTTDDVYGHLREDTAARMAVERIYTGQPLRAVK